MSIRELGMRRIIVAEEACPSVPGVGGTVQVALEPICDSGAGVLPQVLVLYEHRGT